MSSEGSTKAIMAALAANCGIAIAKFVGFAITGSSSMLAEGVHSVADTSNQGLLLLGQKRAAKSASRLHPFGYGRNRYFYSFVVALVIFSLGSLFAIFEGVEKIIEPHELESPLVAVVILVIAMALEGYSFTTAFRESAPLKGSNSWWRFIHTTRSPELPVVLLEDAGALCGLVFALAGVGLSELTGDPIWDGIGTLAIGVLLGGIAIILITEMQSLLIGEGVTPSDERRLIDTVESVPGIERLIHMKTQYLGPDELLLAAKIAIPRGTEASQIARTIDTAEERIRGDFPAARIIYLEPDIDRGTGKEVAAHEAASRDVEPGE
ncbi:cation diffusion facilitator family transporter [Williamsia sterculiae]|uniref:Cation diffusion facilitator family transporter n=1 Tax=Williamsia sterculiae TaxID=1344003 RepID=A0A1N7GSR7_9NOCA|nr:cation diffusion facilitator family transporter [Williamsia sterculiae]SIS15625.1 cation diffusion facilitator family transporter [Williamsia sterculiae]